MRAFFMLTLFSITLMSPQGNGLRQRSNFDCAAGSHLCPVSRCSTDPACQSSDCALCALNGAVLETGQRDPLLIALFNLPPWQATYAKCGFSAGGGEGETEAEAVQGALLDLLAEAGCL